MIKKVSKTLISLMIILIVVLVTFLNYAEQKEDVSQKIGNKIYGGTISTIDFAKIVKVYNTYNEMLKNGEYQEAYNALSYEYMQYKDYENFLKDIKNNEITIADEILDIRQLTAYMYMITVNAGETQFQSLIIYNPNSAKYHVVPNTLLEHKEINKKIKKDNVVYEILETNNYIDKFVLNMKIINLDKKNTAEIDNIKLNRNNGLRMIKGNISNIELKPLEEKNISIEFETDIDFPKEIEISRTFLKNNSIKTYSVNLK